MATKPTVVLVPGAWHSPAHFDTLAKLLNAAGYPTVSKQLPSVDTTKPHTTTCSGDSKFILEEILNPLLSEGKDVVVMAHSYAGAPTGAAVNGLSKVERTAAGKKGGIIGLVCVAALLASEGASLLATVGGKFHDWVQVDNPSAGYTYPATPEQVFYNDITDKATLDFAISTLRKMSTTALSTGAGAPGWENPGYRGKIAYVRTAKDMTIPDFAQDGMMQGSGVTWDVQKYDTGHSPFLSQPEMLVQTIDTLVQKWTT